MNINATIFGQIISFVLFVWFCMKYVWYPLMSIIENRQKEIADSFASIECIKLESERMHSEALICLQESRTKAKEIIKQANEYKTKMLYNMQCEIDRERNAILSQARLQISREKQLIIDELKKKFGLFVVNGVERIIEHSINEIIDRDFIDHIIKNMKDNF